MGLFDLDGHVTVVTGATSGIRRGTWLARVTLVTFTQEESTQLSTDEVRAEFRTFVVPAFLP